MLEGRHPAQPQAFRPEERDRVLEGRLPASPKPSVQQHVTRRPLSAAETNGAAPPAPRPQPHWRRLAQDAFMNVGALRGIRDPGQEKQPHLSALRPKLPGVAKAQAAARAAARLQGISPRARGLGRDDNPAGGSPSRKIVIPTGTSKATAAERSQPGEAAATGAQPWRATSAAIQIGAKGEVQPLETG